MSRILIIDDEESMRYVIRGMLAIEGHTSMEAADGDIGVRLCHEDPPDLIITDLVMPNKEGIETIMEVRECHPTVKIIAISGGGSLDPTSFLEAAKALGADYALQKPFKSSELLDAVRDLLSDETRP